MFSFENPEQKKKATNIRHEDEGNEVEMVLSDDLSTLHHVM